MFLFVFVWVAIVVIWSFKAASQQKSSEQRQANLPADDAGDGATAAGRSVPPLAGRDVPALARDAASANAGSRREVATAVRREARQGSAVRRAQLAQAADAGSGAVDSRAADPCAAGMYDAAACAAGAYDAAPNRTPPLSDEVCGRSRAAAVANLLGEPFDLRRAVLYSEILKPKFEE